MLRCRQSGIWRKFDAHISVRSRFLRPSLRTQDVRRSGTHRRDHAARAEIPPPRTGGHKAAAFQRPNAFARTSGQACSIDPCGHFDLSRRKRRSRCRHRRGGASPFRQHHPLDRLSVDGRRLWRPSGRMGRRNHGLQTFLAPQSGTRRSRKGVGTIERTARNAARDLKAFRHLWAGPQCLRQSESRHRAARHQGKPDFQPHPCR